MAFPCLAGFRISPVWDIRAGRASIGSKAVPLETGEDVFPCSFGRGLSDRLRCATASAQAPQDDLPSPCAEQPDFYTAYANGILLRRVKDCQRLVVKAPSKAPKVQCCHGLAALCCAGQDAGSGAILRRGGAAGARPQGSRARDAGRSSRARHAGAGRSGAPLRRSLAGPDDGAGGRSGLRGIAAEGDGRDGRGGQWPAGPAIGLAHRRRRYDGCRAPGGGNRGVSR